MPILIRWETDSTMTLQLAGTIDTRCVPDVERALQSARQMHCPVVLDLGKLRLIDRPTIQYVLDLIHGDVRSVVNCPEDVMRWMRREDASIDR